MKFVADEVKDKFDDNSYKLETVEDLCSQANANVITAKRRSEGMVGSVKGYLSIE